MWWILLLSFNLFALEMDLGDIRSLDEALPEFYPSLDNEHLNDSRTRKDYSSPAQETSWVQIKNSPLKIYGVPKGAKIFNLNDKTKSILNPKLFYAKGHEYPDEEGYLYLVNKNNEVIYKVLRESISDIQAVSDLYEDPKFYTTYAPQKDNHFNPLLRWKKSLGGGLQIIKPDFISDLLNDDEVNRGYGPRFFGHLQTIWDLPFQLGIIAGYDLVFYQTSYRGSARHDSILIGPTIETKKFLIFNTPLSFLLELKTSLKSRLTYRSELLNTSFDFRSTQTMLALKYEENNDWGSWFIQFGLENQWWTIKNQREPVALSSKTNTNMSYLVLLGQAF